MWFAAVTTGRFDFTFYERNTLSIIVFLKSSEIPSNSGYKIKFSATISIAILLNFINSIFLNGSGLLASLVSVIF
jgi:hypothetical protein